MNTTKTETVNKARLNPGQQWIGIDNIILDERFQPRAKTDFDWVRDLSGFRKDGSEFPPVRVYQLPDGRLVAASGHHRIPAMRMAGEEQVLCEVVDGTEEDAIVYAAGSNKSNGVKPMGPKDITKAVEMLLAVDEWRKKSDAVIAGHVGCGPSKVRNIRIRLNEKYGWPLPDEIVGVDSRTRKRPSNTKAGKYRVIRRGNRYQTKVGGRTINSSSLKELYEQAEEACLSIEAKKVSLEIENVRSRLLRFGFSGIGAPAGFPGLRGIWKHGIICLPVDFSTPEILRLAIADLIASRRYKGDLSARMVVLCYPEDGPAKVIDLYRQEGFEFLTPEELSESLKGDQP